MAYRALKHHSDRKAAWARKEDMRQMRLLEAQYKKKLGIFREMWLQQPRSPRPTRANTAVDPGVVSGPGVWHDAEQARSEREAMIKGDHAAMPRRVLNYEEEL